MVTQNINYLQYNKTMIIKNYIKLSITVNRTQNLKVTVTIDTKTNNIKTLSK